MRIGSPMAAPRMVPAKVSPKERHEDTIARRLIVVGPDPVEAAVERDVPRIAEAACDNLQALPTVIATQHPAIQTPIISRIVIGTSVFILTRRHRNRDVRHIGRRLKSPQVTKRLRRVTARLIESLRVPFAHIELAVRSPAQSMESVFQIAEIGIDLDVLIGLIIAIKIADHRQIRRIGDPQFATVPGESLNRIEPRRELLRAIRSTIAVCIEHHYDAVTRSFRRRIAVLRPHPDKQSPPLVKRHRARLPHQRLTGKERDLKPWWHFG